MNLDGCVMEVSATASSGIVGTGTQLRFLQRGRRVLGQYAGGRVPRGYLVGRLDGGELVFRYLQREDSGELHGGESWCEVVELADGRRRLVEHFQWSTREGSGVNVFDEVPSPTGSAA